MDSDQPKLPSSKHLDSSTTGMPTGGALSGGNRVAVLVLTTGAEPRAYRLHKERIVLGSVVSADVRLSGNGVAPIHAVLEVSASGTAGGDSSVGTIYDLASSTGVFVNGKKVVTQSLSMGDEIQIGANSFKFFIEDLAQAQAQQPQALVRESEGRKLFVEPGQDLSSLMLEPESRTDEIFDYSGTHRQALEVVMSWGGTILDVEHFTDEKEVFIGDHRKNHFIVPPVISVLSKPGHAIVTRSGDSKGGGQDERFTLNLDPQMGGVIFRKGRLQSVQDVCSELRGGSGAYSVPMEKNDFAKISVKDIDFYLGFTPAPPKLRFAKQFERDPFLWKSMTSSLLLTVLSLVGISKIKVPETLEAEQIPDRIATILYQPEKYSVPRIKIPNESAKPVETVKAETQPKEPKVIKIDLVPNAANANKPVPKEMNVGAKAGIQNKATQLPKQTLAENQAKQGKGARAKGESGTRGSPKAGVGKVAQEKAMRPSPQGGKGAGGGQSQVSDIGNVDFLKGAGAKIEDLLANSAANLGKAGEKLKGFGGFTTRGNGGLALSGQGAGGGGTAESLGGLSNTGRGGARVGTGLGAAGEGSGIVGGKSRVVIRSGGNEDAVVMGAIDASAIEAALLAHRDEFRLCYEREINAENPNLAGRVGTSFVIGSSGRVTQAGVASTTLNHANTERCVLTVIKRIDFPVPRGGGLVQVTYPFKFTPAGK